ncbi:MAG: hypothetical protein IAI49_14200, partial [Candidatus Eremiobacteraeota bacterium]|nr:hypothetical protein [Candidatus Eremiobacteraeota bacterium]
RSHSPEVSPSAVEPAADAAEALARLRLRVAGLLRAALANCRSCDAPLDASAADGRCAPCLGQAERERELVLTRLIYMAPWLTLAELREQLPDLSGAEFERARRLLLQRWWLILERAKAAGTVSRSGLERHVASSYVLLQSRLAPDRITPAIVGNLLGEDVVRLLWPSQSPVSAPAGASAQAAAAKVPVSAPSPASPSGPRPASGRSPA